MVATLAFAQLFAGLNLIQQLCNFVDIQTDNFFFVQLWQEYTVCRIALNHFFLIEIFVETAQGGEFPLDARFLVQFAFPLLCGSVLQILHIFLEVGRTELFQKRKRNFLGCAIAGSQGIFAHQILKEYAQIISIRNACAGLCSGFNAAEIRSAVVRKLREQFPKM